MQPELACGVLSYRDEPGLVDAVRSILAQGDPVEVIVVNSGGGDPASRLTAAGISVPVVSTGERLYPGGARNVVVDRTQAPYVSFLAADCIAEPGWVAGRLREHRRGAVAVAATVTNAEPGSRASWAAYLLLHNRLVTADSSQPHSLYGLSYDRRLFERYGAFAEDLRAGEDTEFNARFSGEHAIVKPPDVGTAHRYPTTTRAFIRDAFRRGRLQATMLGAIAGRRPRSLLVATRAVLNVPHALRFVLDAPRDDRGRLLGAYVLVMPGGLVYALGALTTAVRPYRSTPPAASARTPPVHGRRGSEATG